MTETEWEKYGTGRNPKCANCMVHCGYEPTAVNDTFKRPWEALKVAVFGPRTDGPMAPELPVLYEEEAFPELKLIAEIKPVPVPRDSSNKQVA